MKAATQAKRTHQPWYGTQPIMVVCASSSRFQYSLQPWELLKRLLPARTDSIVLLALAQRRRWHLEAIVSAAVRRRG